MNKTAVTFGEVMMRLSTACNLRLAQAHSLEVTYGGGEANVAVSLANYGIPVDLVTRLPLNDIGEACVRYIRQFGVGTDKVIWGGDRVGIYFLETGAAQRGSKVTYDRSHSAMATIEPGMIDWRRAFADADWFHWTGITPAISGGAADACLEAIHTAREMGLTVSCDLNYRAKLWKWGRTASEVMPQLVELCDIAVGNEEDAEKVFGIKAPGVDVLAGQVDAAPYACVCEQLSKRFANLNSIAITLRGSLSASHNTWSALLWDRGTVYVAPVYDITHIVDRVGAGDAFAGGLIYGLKTDPTNKQRTLNFAVAASCLKHTIVGDFNMVSVAEVEQLVEGDGSGRLAR
jgi:2-dehydro-3-deoxygluconokinase